MLFGRNYVTEQRYKSDKVSQRRNLRGLLGIRAVLGGEHYWYNSVIVRAIVEAIEACTMRPYNAGSSLAARARARARARYNAGRSDSSPNVGGETPPSHKNDPFPTQLKPLPNLYIGTILACSNSIYFKTLDCFIRFLIGLWAINWLVWLQNKCFRALRCYLMMIQVAWA